MSRKKFNIIIVATSILILILFCKTNEKRKDHNVKMDQITVAIVESELIIYSKYWDSKFGNYTGPIIAECIEDYGFEMKITLSDYDTSKYSLELIEIQNNNKVLASVAPKNSYHRKYTFRGSFEGLVKNTTSIDSTLKIKLLVKNKEKLGLLNLFNPTHLVIESDFNLNVVDESEVQDKIYYSGYFDYSLPSYTSPINVQYGNDPLILCHLNRQINFRLTIDLLSKRVSESYNESSFAISYDAFLQGIETEYQDSIRLNFEIDSFSLKYFNKSFYPEQEYISMISPLIVPDDGCISHKLGLSKENYFLAKYHLNCNETPIEFIELDSLGLLCHSFAIM